MIHLGDVLATGDVRAENLQLFHDPSEPYLRSGPFGSSNWRSIEQRIRNVSGRRIRRMLDAVAPFDADSIETAWSHWMALGCGTHVWPDANHRTTFLAFDRAMQKALGVFLDMEPRDAAAMTVESKRLRDQDFRARTRYYTVAELADPDHPYRRHFTDSETALFVVPLDS